MLVKAACVWSSIQAQKLLPGCPPPLHQCEECLGNGLFEWECQACDPDMPILTMIHEDALLAEH